MDLVSPALSAKVLRLGSGSLTRFRQHVETKRIVCHVRPFILCLRLDIAGSLEIGFDRALPCDSDISERPLPGDGIRLGGAIWDLRINWRRLVLVDLRSSRGSFFHHTKFSSGGSIVRSNCYTRRKAIACIKGCKVR